MILDGIPIKDKNGLFFYTYGYQNFPEYILAFPVYFPSSFLCNNFRKINEFYKKIENDRNNKTGYVRSHIVADGLKQANKLGYKIVIDNRYKIPAVKLGTKDIVKIYNPFGHHHKINSLRKKISQYFQISFSEIGVTQSHLIGLNTNDSNIDLAVRGKKNLKKIISGFDAFLNQYNFSKITKERLVRHINFLPDKLNNLKPKAKEKFRPSFIYHKKSVDLHFIKSAEEINLSEVIEEIDTYKFDATIIDSEESFFAPYRFLIKINSPKKYFNQEAYLITFLRFLSGIFENNTRITFVGKLRKIKIGERYFLESTLEEFIK